MIRVRAPAWETLERQSPILFVLGGVLLVGYATLNGIDGPCLDEQIRSA